MHDTHRYTHAHVGIRTRGWFIVFILISIDDRTMTNIVKTSRAKEMRNTEGEPSEYIFTS